MTQIVVIQYEILIGNQWHPVVRYDTAHGFFHRDLLTTNLEIAADIIRRMAIGEEPAAPVVLLSTTLSGDFIQMPIYDTLTITGK